ncbi:hypothetical protein ACQ4PT_014663 [Festuca glaucescens]
MEALSNQERKDELFGAACDGNVRLLKKMARALNSGGLGEAAFMAAMVDDDGDTLLQMAATHGWLDVLRYLVEDLRLDVNQPNSIDVLPKTTACWKTLWSHAFLLKLPFPGYCDVVELLLSRGIDVDLDSARGTPLQVAAMNKQHGTMKILLEHHANPNNAKISLTPLRWVIQDPVPSKSLRCMKLLIKAGADVNFVDSNGFTTVIYAAKLGSPALMKCLLDAGANPNIPDEAMEFECSPDDYATLLANRSLCMLRMGENKRAALSDATECRMVRPFWPKACYRQGAAYMALKEYEKACDAFADGLKLEPTNADIANALREAREALKNAGCSEK